MNEKARNCLAGIEVLSFNNEIYGNKKIGDCPEWRLLKQIKKIGLPQPIKRLSKLFIEKETKKCTKIMSANQQEILKRFPLKLSKLLSTPSEKYCQIAQYKEFVTTSDTNTKTA